LVGKTGEKMKSAWMTWELFEEIYNLPARSFPERCNMEKGLIYVKNLIGVGRMATAEKIIAKQNRNKK